MEEQIENKIKEEKTTTPQKKDLLVGIQYRPAGKIYNFKTDDASLKRGQWVIVEAEHGTSVGTVIVPPREVSPKELPKDVKKVLRSASQEELKEKTIKSEKAMEIFETFCKKAKEHNLPMKPLDAELAEGDKKVILTFFAEERIDFRALVKELAAILHMRIEMRQVGARDEVKCMGGLGVCGLITCCSLHLRNFQSISIQMAKTQGLTPNPAKLTGVCGKLKCCLAYENPIYAEIRKHLPKAGTMVMTPRGEGKVIDFDILQEQCVVRMEDGLEVKVSIKEIGPPGQKITEEPKEQKVEKEEEKAGPLKKEAAPGKKKPREKHKRGREKKKGKSKRKGKR